MPQINLLPWREELRRQRQKSFIQTTLLIGLVTFLIMVAAGQLVGHQISNQNSRNNLIQSQINILNTEIQEVRALRKQRDQLLDWMAIVQNLQHNRGDIVLILNNIAHSTSPQLYLTSLQLENNTLKIEGEAAGNHQIATLIRNLGQSDILVNPQLTDVSASTINKTFNHFTLQLDHKNSSPELPQETP